MADQVAALDARIYVDANTAGSLTSDKLSSTGGPILYADSTSSGYVIPFQSAVAFQNAFNTLMVGAVMPFSMTTPPSGWLEANGQAVSRTDYAELFAKIGTTFGKGDESTTFNLPDIRGEFVRGWDNGRGIDVNRGFGTCKHT